MARMLEDLSVALLHRIWREGCVYEGDLHDDERRRLQYSDCDDYVRVIRRRPTSGSNMLVLSGQGIVRLEEQLGRPLLF